MLLRCHRRPVPFSYPELEKKVSIRLRNGDRLCPAGHEIITAAASFAGHDLRFEPQMRRAPANGMDEIGATLTGWPEVEACTTLPSPT